MISCWPWTCETLRNWVLSMLFSDVLLTWSVHVHVLEKVRPKSLWRVVSSMMVPFIKRDEWCTGLDLREKIIDKVLLALNVASQAFANCEMVCKSALKILAASSGRSTIMYKQVSSANKWIEPPKRLTMSFIKIRKSKWPGIDPYGTPAGTSTHFENLPLKTTRCLRPER